MWLIHQTYLQEQDVFSHAFPKCNIFNNISILTLCSDRLRDDHGHPDMTANSTCCLNALKMYNRYELWMS